MKNRKRTAKALFWTGVGIGLAQVVFTGSCPRSAYESFWTPAFLWLGSLLTGVALLLAQLLRAPRPFTWIPLACFLAGMLALVLGCWIFLVWAAANPG